MAAAFNSVGALPAIIAFGSGSPDAPAAESLKPLFLRVVKTLRACEGALLQMADHEEKWNADVAGIAAGDKAVSLLSLALLARVSRCYARAEAWWHCLCTLAFAL